MALFVELAGIQQDVLRGNHRIFGAWRKTASWVFYQLAGDF
jgi:hypothetical protein